MVVVVVVVVVVVKKKKKKKKMMMMMMMMMMHVAPSHVCFPFYEFTKHLLSIGAVLVYVESEKDEEEERKPGEEDSRWPHRFLPLLFI